MEILQNVLESDSKITDDSQTKETSLPAGITQEAKPSREKWQLGKDALRRLVTSIDWNRQGFWGRNSMNPPFWDRKKTI